MPDNSQTPTPTGDDMVYMNDGDSFQNGIYYPDAPEEQTTKINEEQSAKAGSYPILPKLHKWFEDQIKDCDNMHNIQVSKMTINGVSYGRTVSVEAQVLAYQLLKEKLTEKAHEFDDFAEEQ